jgi:hypothetical protein
MQATGVQIAEVIEPPPDIKTREECKYKPLWDSYIEVINSCLKPYIGKADDNSAVYHCARSISLRQWSSLTPEQKQAMKDYVRKRLTAASDQATVQP